MGWPPVTAPFLRVEAEIMPEKKRQQLYEFLRAFRITLQNQPEEYSKVSRLIELLSGKPAPGQPEHEGAIDAKDLIKLENLISTFRSRIGTSTLEDARNHKTATEVLDLVASIRGSAKKLN